MECLQASGSSRKRPRPLPSSPQAQLNDHIYELYKPMEEPSMDILFFHGLQLGDTTEAYKSTWMCGDDSGQIWPSTWLVEEFPKAHVFSVSYDASMMKTEKQGRFDLYTVAENLIQTICSADIGQALGRPVILVGHSFGGLVIKSLCVKAHYTHSLGSPESESTQKIERFLQNMGGVFFYGTPHRGSSLFDKAASILGGPLLPYVEVLSTESARLDSELTAACKKYGMENIASVGESEPTLWGLFPLGLVVPEASARYGPHFCTARANHITLCQPKSKTSTSFDRLKAFLQGIHPKVQVEDRQVEARLENMQRTPKPLVGVDHAFKKVEHILQENEKVGLVGMGGVGKTTLAMAVVNKLVPMFEYSCFIHVVKEISGNVADLKKEVWSRLHCHDKKMVDSYHGEGSWSKLKGKRILLVLDDISENSDRDLQVLTEIADDISPSKSRFIVTSRNKDRLTEMDEIYGVPFLEDTNAKQLFISCAFPTMQVPIDLESNVNEIVQKCSGLPLTLKLIGSSLRRKTNVKVWTQTLEDLDKANAISDGDKRLWAQLRLSYDSLGESEQQMFLDVTTFFTGTEWTLREAKEAWNVTYGSGDRRWQILLDMCLVYDAKEDEEIKVHEQLESLGRKIASESKKCRIWNETQAWKLLQSTHELDDQQIHTLRAGVKIRVSNNISRSGCRRLKTVRCLDLTEYRIRIAGPRTNERFPTDHLDLLGCDAGDFDYLFSRLTLGRLVVLKLCRAGTLPRSVGQLSALKILNVANCSGLESLPDEIGCLSQLEYLTLEGCACLSELPDSFGALLNLKNLELIECESLETLPESFGELLNLKNLELIYCDSLKTLPESFGKILALNHLKLDGCSRMVTLPDSFGHLPALQKLELISCELENLPESFGQLEALNYLKLVGREGEFLPMVTLPDSFGHLPALQHLEIIECNLETLPESFGQLRALNYLKLEECGRMVTLPDSFGQLPALQKLELIYCELENLPESFGQLQALNYLKLADREFESLPMVLPDSFGHLHALQHLEIDCYYLETLPESFKQLWALKNLKLKGSYEMVTLPDSFGHLPALQNLEFIHCSELHILPESFHHLSTLEHLKFQECPKIYELPKSFGYLPALKHLEFHDCEELHILPESFGHLSTLESLEFHTCDKLNDLPEFFGQLRKLQHLVIDGCPVMKKLPNSLVDLKDLCYLSIQYIGLRSIPDFIETLPSLQTLELGFLPWLRFPPWLEGVAIASPAKPVLRTFHVRHGRFTLHSAEEQGVHIVKEWIRIHVVGKEVRDYDEALAALESWGDLRVNLRDLFSAESKEWMLYLWKNGNAKRLTGDLHGALEDLDAAVEKCIDIRGRLGADSTHLDYICRSERGCVRYLLDDMDGAREDGEVAFQYQSCVMDLLIYECIYYNFEIQYYLSRMHGLERMRELVHRPVLSYLNFRFLGVVEHMANVELMKSSHYQAMEKVARSDFVGVLAIFSFDAVDVRLLGFRAHAFILQERGILRRLTGDLNGAIDDLNSALELISQREFKGGDFRFASGYESLKQRGFVKYLLKDVDGARHDAVAAVRKFNAAPKYNRSVHFAKHEGLDVESVGFPTWEQDPEEWEVAGNKLEIREGWEVAGIKLEIHGGWEVAENEAEVVEGEFFNEPGVYRRLGEQSLKFLGFNLKY